MKKLLLSAVAVLGLMPGLTSTASANTTMYVAEDRSGWVISGCSNETGEGAKLGTLDAMKDGNIGTFWHTVWSGATHHAQNHYFVVDRGEDLAQTALSAVGYSPRTDVAQGNGYVQECDVYILDSVEGLNLYTSSSSAGLCEGDHNIEEFVSGLTPTAHGSFPYTHNVTNNRAESKVEFEPTAGRYILFVATKTNGDTNNQTYGNSFCHCAEFNAYYGRELADEEVLSIQQTAVEALIYKLQTYYGLVQSGSSYSSNKLCASEGNNLSHLLDGVYETYMHTEYNGVGENKHYLQANIGNAVGDFRFFTKKRSQNNNNRPSDITIQGATAADGEYADITSITSGLPSNETDLTYISDEIAGGENTALRFVVNHTNSQPDAAVPFFTYSEFYILPNNEHVAEAAEIYSTLKTISETEYDAIAAEAAKIAELDAAVQALIDAATTDVTFTFPEWNGKTLTLTLNEVKFGTDAASVLLVPDFFTNAAVAEDNTMVSATNNSFTVTGSWTFPFALGIAYRVDLRQSASNNCTNFYYNSSNGEVETRNGNNADAFVPERMFYLSSNGFSTTGQLKVTLHSIAADEEQGFQVSADNNATGAFSATPTEFLVVTNSTGTDGITLQHPDNSNSHANDISGKLGIWSYGNASKNDGGSYFRFKALEDADFDAISPDFYEAEAINSAKASKSAADVRAMFAASTAYAIAVEAANVQLARCDGFTAEHFGETLGYYTGASYETIVGLVTDLNAAIEAKEVATIEEKTAALQTELDNVYLILPEAGKFYRFKGYANGKYITPAGSGKMAQAEEPTAYSVFRFEEVEGSADTFRPINVKCDAGITNTHSLTEEGVVTDTETYRFVASMGKIPGVFTVISSYSGSQYLHDNGDTADRYGAYDSSNHATNWYLEEVNENGTTGIEEIVVESAMGQGIYDLQGRRLSAPVKGINIINGKKVLVK